MRYAVYFVPDAATPLADLGCRWLGYDVETGTTFAAPVIAGFDAGRWQALVATPARYGLHATLKAPFRLAGDHSEADLVEALRAFARRHTPVRIPVLSLVALRGFLALAPAVPEPGAEALAASALRAFEPFRAPLDAADIARREAAGLNDRQRARLAEWGYPYVLDEGRFHLTMTGRIPAGQVDEIEDVLADFMEPVIGRSLLIDRVVLAVEREPGASFQVLATASLGDPLAYMRRVVAVETI